MNIEYALLYMLFYLGEHIDQVIGFAGVIVVVIAALFMANRSMKAFPTNLISHALWGTNGWLTSNWALVVLNVILTILTCYTWWNFTKHKQWK